MVYKKDLELHKKWAELMTDLKSRIGKRPKDLNHVLFLIGIQELGKGIREFSKEEKQGLMHIAICRLLSTQGFYTLEGLDEDGWPHWKKKGNIPKLDLAEQEVLLKKCVIEYFHEEF
jgi:hypothetical protein